MVRIDSKTALTLAYMSLGFDMKPKTLAAKLQSDGALLVSHGCKLYADRGAVVRFRLAGYSPNGDDVRGALTKVVTDAAASGGVAQGASALLAFRESEVRLKSS